MAGDRRHERFDPTRVLRDLASPVALDPDLEPESLFGPSRPPLPHVLAVFVGGFLGTLLRYAVVFHHPAHVDMVDWSIVLINCSGAFVLGVLGTTLFAHSRNHVGVRLFLATGFLGGWTTYSAIIAGSLTLFHAGSHAAAVANLLVELIGPVVAAGLGLLIGAAGAQRWL